MRWREGFYNFIVLLFSCFIYVFNVQLLNSGDKVLLVEMCSESHANFSIPDIREEKIWFQVSELDVERRDWNQVEDVDGRVLFLGNIAPSRAWLLRFRD